MQCRHRGVSAVRLKPELRTGVYFNKVEYTVAPPLLMLAKWAFNKTCISWGGGSV